MTECKGYINMGYSAIKLKIGGAPVEEYVDRVTAVRVAVGPEVNIMVDVDEGY